MIREFFIIGLGGGLADSFHEDLDSLGTHSIHNLSTSIVFLYNDSNNFVQFSITKM